MNLYLRLLMVWLRACFKPSIRIGDTIELPLRVWPNDLDINGHMNNGRYMTIIDLGLIEYMTRSDFIRAALRQGWRPVLGGALISFRRGLKPFRRYQLHFTVQGRDSRWTYMRFAFVHHGQIMATGLAKGAMVSRCGFVETDRVYGVIGVDTPSPVLPSDVLAWREAERALHDDPQVSPIYQYRQ